MPEAQSRIGGRADLVIHYLVREDGQQEFLTAQAEMVKALAAWPDYLGGEQRRDPTKPDTGWTAVAHFRDAAAARAWADSSELADLHQGLGAVLVAEPTMNVLLTPVPQAIGTAVISSRVRPGSEDWFHARQGQMQAAQARYPGYLGQRDQAPIAGVNPDWVTVIAYDTAEHLQAWLDSPQRHQFLSDAVGNVDSFECRPASSAFESWFAGVEREGAPPPPAWKLNAIVLLVLYPVVMAEIFWLYPLMAALSVPMSTFVGNVISVAVTGFLLIPLASRLLTWWLVPAVGRGNGVNWRGTALLAVGYALCIAAFEWIATRAG